MTERSPSDGSRTWFLVALFDLLAAAIIGVLLRAMYIVEIPFVQFRPWLHGHSHTALLGWLFIGICTALLHDGGSRPMRPAHLRLFLGLQAAVLVMLVSFPWQGYGAISITASSIHMLLAYILLGLLWRRSLIWPKQGSGALLRTAIIFFVLSTLGVWAIGPIIALHLQGQEIYYWAVQFFLHFQFNGWFWFAAMALGVRWAERQGLAVRLDRLTLALWIASALLTFALAIAWSEPHPAVFATVSLGVVLQLWAALRTLRILRTLRSEAGLHVPRWPRIIIGVALVSMALKVLVQASVAIPPVAVMAFTIRHYVMGFIHLNTLGTMTMLLLAYALLHDWLDVRRWATRMGLAFTVAGIIVSELLLFGQGTFFWAALGLIPGHYWHMVIASALIPIGVILLLLSALSPSSAKE